MMDSPNLNYIEQLADGDKEFEQQFISIIKEEFPKEKDVYIKAIVAHDWHEASQIVHKLKHKLNILGMEKSYGIAVAFEDELNAKNGERDSDFRQILGTVDMYIKNI